MHSVDSDGIPVEELGHVALLLGGGLGGGGGVGGHRGTCSVLLMPS